MNKTDKNKLVRAVALTFIQLSNTVLFLISAALTVVSMITFGVLLTYTFNSFVYLTVSSLLSVSAVMLQLYGLHYILQSYDVKSK